MPPRARRLLWPLLALLLPLALVASSLATLARLAELRDLYLRAQAAALVARLEALGPSPAAGQVEALAEQEPALLDLAILDLDEQGPEREALAAIREGRELFHTERRQVSGVEVFRAYIPYHAGGQLRVAKLDLAASAADFLLAPARQNVVAASLSGLALLLLSLYALWSLKRAAQLERRQLELEHLARLGQMAATLAHEIRNPLATIKGFAQLAAEKADEQTASLLAPIAPEVERLERLVKNLLDYGRPVQPRPRWFEWDALASELETNVRELTAGRPLRLHLPPSGLWIHTDPDLLKGALLNLLRNAVEAVGHEGEIRLSVATSRDGVTIAVEDDGPGLSEEARRHLFEPFFTTKAFGSGLGLPTSRKLIETLGGRLRLVALVPRGTRAEAHFPAMPWRKVGVKEGEPWPAS
ncbi:MAG: HAMP domain-containing sensor histidine kinase [Bryobacterales bacterium]|nr:HAMP domain-containing sensor histidine kinase [Bryobacterales bacterium]